MECSYRNALPLSDIPVLEADALNALLCERVAKGWRLALLCGVPRAILAPDEPGTGLLCLLLHDATGRYAAFSTPALETYASFTLACPQAHMFEREIYEQWGILPEGHPWLKPVRFITPAAGGPRPLPGDADYFRVEGSEVHEVAVGPVHAGVIEPGHFRFQCYGEKVMYLEIGLGFQHRAVETLLRRSPPTLTPHLVECTAGDTSIGHTTAWSVLLEILAGAPATERGQALRSVALELERLACHTGDLGALGGDVGFLPTSSWCGRIRGDFLNMTALLCGNRFGRGMVRPGGAACDVDAARTAELLRRLEATHRDARGAVDVMLESAMVLDRFSHTGTVSKTAARDLGLVGMAARACGLEQDARFHYPQAPVPASPVRMRIQESGDVMARALVRSRELDDAASIIRQHLEKLPEGPARAAIPRALQPGMLAVACVEGWRGAVFHAGISGADGALAWHKMVDPSFHNWTGLAMALREQEISDFPLCNKSFNLSYCGHDL